MINGFVTGCEELHRRISYRLGKYFEEKPKKYSRRHPKDDKYDFANWQLTKGMLAGIPGAVLSPTIVPFALNLYSRLYKNPKLKESNNENKQSTLIEDIAGYMYGFNAVTCGVEIFINIEEKPLELLLLPAAALSLYSAYCSFYSGRTINREFTRVADAEVRQLRP